MSTIEMLRKLFLIWNIIIVAIVIIILLGVERFIPIISKILTGLALTGIFLGAFLLDLERQTKREVLEELECRLGKEKFKIAKGHLNYKNYFNISINEKCPKSIRKKVLQYFNDLGIKCRQINRITKHS